MLHKILFLHRGFYQYDNFIYHELKKEGHELYQFNINAENDIFYYCLTHINRPLSEKILIENDLKLQQNLLNYLRNQKIIIDVVFVLAGQRLNSETLAELRLLYPNAKFVWYIWDNTVYLNDFYKNRIFFDSIISFDKFEAEKLNLKFFPLFYIKEFYINWKLRKYDISFIGSTNISREEIISEFIKRNKIYNLYFFISVGFFHKIATFHKRAICPYMKIKKLEYEKTLEILSQSKCILDIPSDLQTGLTMRTFESIGARAKLITTNSMIKNYDFYEPENIFILNSKTLEMPKKDFFESPYKELDKEIFEKYSLKNWIKQLVSYFD